MVIKKPLGLLLDVATFTVCNDPVLVRIFHRDLVQAFVGPFDELKSRDPDVNAIKSDVRFVEASSFLGDHKKPVFP
jgi:hypothetical protein